MDIIYIYIFVHRCSMCLISDLTRILNIYESANAKMLNALCIFHIFIHLWFRMPLCVHICVRQVIGSSVQYLLAYVFVYSVAYECNDEANLLIFHIARHAQTFYQSTQKLHKFLPNVGDIHKATFLLQKIVNAFGICAYNFLTSHKCWEKFIGRYL